MSDDEELTKVAVHASFFTEAFPEDERDTAWQVSSLLLIMHWYAVDLLAAIDLFTYCNARYKSALAARDDNDAIGFMRQAHVPARDGAMSIYHFGTAIEQIRSKIYQSPELRRRVHSDELRVAYAQFKSHFPNFDKLRHGIAHAADEIAGTPREIIFSDRYIVPRLTGARYRTNHEGAEVSYELTERTFGHLRAVLILVYRAFRDVDSDATRALLEGKQLSML